MENTAVEILVDYMEANFHLTDESRAQFRLALAEEKQQIIDAANQDVFADFSGVTKGEYYYHSTYGK